MVAVGRLERPVRRRGDRCMRRSPCSSSGWSSRDWPRRCRCSSSGDWCRGSAREDRPSRCTSSSRACTRPRSHGRVFAAFSAAWVVPSLVGPFLAGAVTEYLHWRWVFLGVALLTVSPSPWSPLRLHGLPLHTDHPSGRAACSVGSRAPSPWPSAHWRSASRASSGRGRGWRSRHPSSSSRSLSRPLLPRRTLRAARGPAERDAHARADRRRAVRRRDLRPVPADRRLRLLADLGGARADRGGAAVGAAATCRAGSATGSATPASPSSARRCCSPRSRSPPRPPWAHLPPAVLVAGWALAGAGMGLMYPRLTVLTLAYSTPAESGLQLVRAVDLGFGRGLGRDRRDGSRVHRAGRDGCRFPRRVRDRRGAVAARARARPAARARARGGGADAVSSRRAPVASSP